MSEEIASLRSQRQRNDTKGTTKLKIEKTIEENHEAKLVVEIDPEMMDKYKRKAARKISERGKIAGFRPGKAPYEMVVRNYGEQAVVEQAIDFLIDAEYSNILQEADVNPGAAGSLEIGRFTRAAEIYLPSPSCSRSGSRRLPLDPHAV